MRNAERGARNSEYGSLEDIGQGTPRTMKRSREYHRSKPMKYLNANAMIGAHFAPREGRFFSAEDLLEEMDFFGIDEALVHHGLAREYDQEVGNTQLLDELCAYPRLHPCWIAETHQSGEYAPPGEFVQRALDSGVAAVKLSLGMLGDTVIPDIVTYRELFRELEKHCFPTLVFFESLTPTPDNIKQLDEVLAEFTALPLILSLQRAPGDIMRMLHARLAAYRNLRLEIAGIHFSGGLEYITETFGPERLIYSTWFPYFGSGQTKIALAYADLRDSDREAIAYWNLKNLIGGIAK